ncbi:hypothetical protein EGM70_18635 [Enterobacteriaceae bacterium 89]|nr:hypothetical protein [Enterobacteriaceae bacterium 89]
MRRLDFNSSWDRQRPRAGSTPVTFRQNAFPSAFPILFIHKKLPAPANPIQVSSSLCRFACSYSEGALR